MRFHSLEKAPLLYCVATHVARERAFGRQHADRPALYNARTRPILIDAAELPGDEMDVATVAIPVRCPQCDRESLYNFPEIVVLTALTRWNNMQLYAPCHDISWSATPSELQRIRQYLGDNWINARHPR